MKTKNKPDILRAAAHGAIAAGCMSLAADLSVCYTLVLAVGWDWQDPAHTGLPWFVPIGLLTALTLGLFLAADKLLFKAQELEDKANIAASIRRMEQEKERLG